jgi:hypothetical protein
VKEHDYFEYLNNLSIITIAFVGFAGLFLGFKTTDKATPYWHVTRSIFLVRFWLGFRSPTRKLLSG